MLRHIDNTTSDNNVIAMQNRLQTEEISKLASLMRKEKLGTLSRQWLNILIRKYPLIYKELLKQGTKNLEWV